MQAGLVMKSRNSQRGMALLILVFFLALVATAYGVQSLNATNIKNERDKKTALALAEAKAALIGWSARQTTVPGSLPCTDSNNGGSLVTAFPITQNCAAYIGHLPWKTLEISDLRDGDGECLWYALSPVYRSAISAASRNAANKINNTVPGTITIKSANGVNLPAPINPIIAVIIAPGASLSGQNHNNAGVTQCGGNITASNYLDSANGVNNATGNVSGNNYIFTTGDSSSTFNDKVAYITAEELYRAVRRRMVKEILGNVNVLAGPAKYYSLNGNYPCPASTPAGASMASPCLSSTGYTNNSLAMGLQYASLGSWLANNDWFANATYSYTNPTSVKLSIVDGLGSYSCLANSNTFTCSSP